MFTDYGLLHGIPLDDFPQLDDPWFVSQHSYDKRFFAFDFEFPIQLQQRLCRFIQDFCASLIRSQ